VPQALELLTERYLFDNS